MQQQPNSLSSENGANSDEGMGDEEPVQDSVLQDESSNNETNEDGNASENAAVPAIPAGGGAAVPAVVRDADNYEVYYYDQKSASNTFRNLSNDSSNPGDGKNGEKLDVFKDLRTSIDDPFEVKFMRAEGIYAHGYHSHACQIAVALAKDLLESPLKYNLFSGAGGGNGSGNNPESGSATGGSATGTTNRKKKRVSAASHKVTQDASKTLSHCAFLCTVVHNILISRDLFLKFKILFHEYLYYFFRSSAKFRNIVAWPSKWECLVLKWPGRQPLQNPWRSNWPIRNLNL